MKWHRAACCVILWVISVSKLILKMPPVQNLSFFEAPFRVWKPSLLTEILLEKSWCKMLVSFSFVYDVSHTWTRRMFLIRDMLLHWSATLLSEWLFPGYRHTLMYFHRTLSLRSLWTPASQKPGSHFVHTDTACFHVLWHAHTNVINHTARGTHAVSNV